MSTDSSARIPSYRKYKATGQTCVTLNGRAYYLGRFGSPESKQAYQRLIKGPNGTREGALSRPA